jgi:hypothetical protein
MNDDRLQDLLKDAAREYRVPKDPPLDVMWARIEREHFDAPVAAPADLTAGGPGRSPRWLRAVAGIAATLVVGFGIGRVTAPGNGDGSSLPAAVDLAANPVVRSPADPLQRTASAYLDDAEFLLASLPREASALDSTFVTRARQMLVRTRVLLDSPIGADPELRNMLEDMELVLAQMARLRTRPGAEELTFIAAAMDERDVVPRLRTAAAALSNSDY